MGTKRHQHAMQESARARGEVSKGESSIWAEGTRFTAEELEAGYESHVVAAIENGSERKSFEQWCQQDMGIPAE